MQSRGTAFLMTPAQHRARANLLEREARRMAPGDRVTAARLATQHRSLAVAIEASKAAKERPRETGPSL